jgi:hypothetical protein
VGKEKASMNEISAMASSVLVTSQSRTQEQISMSIIKTNAQAEQTIADMLIQNAHQIEALSQNAPSGIIDIHV